MLPKYHILIGFIFSLLLFLFVPSIGFLGAGAIFLSSFLLDIDHYFYYVFKKKDFNFKRSVKWFMKKRILEKKIPRNKLIKNYYTGFYIFHGIETLLILFALGFFVSRLFIFFFVGVTLHLALDHVEQIHRGKRIDKISSFYDFIKFKKMKLIE